MMSICISSILKIYLSFKHYNDTVGFTSFICTDDNADYISGDNAELFYANLILLSPTSDYRIFGIFCYKPLFL